MDKLINKQLAKELEKSLLSELAELNIKGYQQYKVLISGSHGTYF